MRALVIDASVALKWLVDEPFSDKAEPLRSSELELFAPDFLLLECANATRKMVHRKIIGESSASEIIKQLDELPVELVSSDILLKMAFRLAIDLKESVYDCLYLALAIAYGCPFVTADKRFCDAVTKTKYRHHVISLQNLN